MAAHRLTSLASAFALVALVACSGGGEAGAQGTEEAGAAPAETAADAADSQGLEMRLASTGLDIGRPGPASAERYEFGMARDTIVALVSRYRGAPTGTGSNEECGAGAMEFTEFGPLTLNFQDGRWVGWSMAGGAGDPPLRSDYGAAIGVARSAIDDALSVEETSLGTEFDALGIYGILSGPGPDARIEHLWAGTSCNFR